MSVDFDEIKADITKGTTALDTIKNIEVDLADEIQKGADVFTGIKDFANKINVMYYASLIIMILSLLIIIYLQYKNIYEVAKYLMIPIASASGVILLAALFTKSSAIRAIENGLKFETTAEIQSIIYNLFDGIVLNRYNSIIMTSAIIFFVSIAIYVVSILIHRKKHS